MKNDFLSANEYTGFEKAYKNRLKKNEGCVIEKDDKITSLSDEIGDRVLQYQKRLDYYSLIQDVMIIYAGRNHNITLCCEDVAANLQKSLISWNIVNITNNDNAAKNPAILKHITQKNLLSIGRKAGIIPGKRQKLLIFGTLLFTVLTVFTFNTWYFLKWFENGLSLFGVSLLFTVCIWLYSAFIDHQDIGSKAVSEKIIATIKEPENIIPYQRLVQNIADFIVGKRKPIAVIVNDFNAMDLFTQKVLIKIINSDGGALIGLILWIIFESKRTRRTSRLTIVKKLYQGNTNDKYFVEYNLFKAPALDSKPYRIAA